MFTLGAVFNIFSITFTHFGSHIRFLEKRNQKKSNSKTNQKKATAKQYLLFQLKVKGKESVTKTFEKG
jgi:hypothetical protein